MRRIIVALTGASGAMFGIRALQLLRATAGVEIHLILSPAGVRTLIEETGMSAADARALADHNYDHRDIGAALASGSFRTAGMLVAPCSIKTLSAIAHCYDDDLIVRAADVCLKERRPVVLMVRETPLHAGHLRLMLEATANGAIVMPPVPAFYLKPTSIADIVDQLVARALDLLGIEVPALKHWKAAPTDPVP